VAIVVVTCATTSTIDVVDAASRAIRVPRVIVQTKSKVDILDDAQRGTSRVGWLLKEIQIQGN
jgi:hypothetical protein